MKVMVHDTLIRAVFLWLNMAEYLQEIRELCWPILFYVERGGGVLMMVWLILQLLLF
jgi:hypothetical protein